MKRKISMRRVALLIGIIVVLTNLVTFALSSKYYSEKADEEIQSLKEIATMKWKAKMKEIEGVPAKGSFHIDSDKVKNIKNVMIVAHPDDETLWGGADLEKEDFLVICLTNGDNEVRKKEFMKTMEKTKDYGIILNYPDNPNHVKSTWENEKDAIYNDIDYIVNYKKWDKIITHNPEGEYGHIHHKFTSMMVTENCVRDKLTDHLSYFGKYYKNNQLIQKGIPVTLSNEEIQFKHEIMQSIYVSQGHAYQLFAHMIPYEQLISYDDWYFGI